MSGAATPARPATLITVPPMIDSEFCRFLLVRYRVPYVEEPHGFAFSFLYTLRHGRSIVAPMVYNDGYAVVGPKGIVDRFDARVVPALRLLRDDPAASVQIQADIARFNGALASAVANYAYDVLLPMRDIMIDPLTRGCPWWEVGTVRLAYPLFAGALRLLLGLSPEKTRQSLVQIRAILDEVAARIAGGGYLVGDRLSLSDLAFATAAAPVVMPENDGSASPTFEGLPPEMKAVVTEFRSHPAGRFVQRIYREERVAPVRE